MEAPKEVSLWMNRLENIVSRCTNSQEQEPDFFIYSAPPPLIKEDEDIRRSLQPTVVTVGPVHYNPSKDVFWEGNKLKEEALDKIVAENPFVEWSAIFRGLLQKIMEEEETIKACYVNRNAFPPYLTGDSFGWMIVADCCFLLQVFNLMSHKSAVDRNRWPRLTVLEDTFKTRLRDWVLDLIKIDNQIPLWVVAKVADSLPGWESTQTEISRRVEMLEVMFCLSPVQGTVVKFKGEETFGKKEGNLLHLLRLVALGDEEKRDAGAPPEWPAENTNNCSEIREICVECFEEFTWSSIICPDWECHRSVYCLINSAVLMVFLILFIALFATIVPVFLAVFSLMIPFVLIGCIWARPYQEENAQSKLRATCLSTSVSLKRTRNGIMGTQLKHNVLWLPCMDIVGEHAKVMLSNMMALERSNPRLRKKICNYVSLTSQLLDTPEDVEELKNREVMWIRDKDSEWVSGMWKSLRKLAQDTIETDATDPITKTREALLRLPRPSRVHLIWPAVCFWTGDLRRRYGANPWVALSATAAILLLFMTGAQVVCLFVSCSPKTNAK